jgi:hypothetical protein
MVQRTSGKPVQSSPQLDNFPANPMIQPAVTPPRRHGRAFLHRCLIPANFVAISFIAALASPIPSSVSTGRPEA